MMAPETKKTLNIGRIRTIAYFLLLLAILSTSSWAVRTKDLSLLFFFGASMLILAGLVAFTSDSHTAVAVLVGAAIQAALAACVPLGIYCFGASLHGPLTAFASLQFFTGILAALVAVVLAVLSRRRRRKAW